MQIPKILDCTIRDGGYMTNWHFDDRLVRDVYRAVSKAGVDYVELGYHGTTRFFDPEKYGTWRFCPEAAIRKAIQGIQGARVTGASLRRLWSLPCAGWLVKGRRS